MKILGREIKAAIIDMDGTLIDSTGIWVEIDREFFARRGMSVPEDFGKEVVHMGLEDGAKMTIARYGFNNTPEEIIKEWRDASIEQYTNKIPLKEGAIELLEFFKNNNVKMSIATANDEELYRPCLERLGIEKYFDFITDVNEVKEGKASPKLYNLVCQKLNVNPSETIIFEDTTMALKTAYENGYLTVAVYDRCSEKYDDEKHRNSHMFIKSFDDFLKLYS